MTRARARDWRANTEAIVHALREPMRVCEGGAGIYSRSGRLHRVCQSGDHNALPGGRVLFYVGEWCKENA
jgi:hypothetical protein